MFAGGGDVCRWVACLPVGGMFAGGAQEQPRSAIQQLWFAGHFARIRGLQGFGSVHGTGQRDRFILLDLSLNEAPRLVFRRT